MKLPDPSAPPRTSRAGLAAWSVAVALFAHLSASAAVQVPTGFVNDAILGDLDEPTSFAFLPDGRLLLTEQRTGKVRMVVNGTIASTDPVLTVPSLNSSGYERGLQGVTVDPGWPARPYVYLFYSRTGGFLRLVRYTASGSLTDPNSGTLTLGSSLLLIDDIPDENQNHNSGCLRFGPDGMLYVSLGDDDIYPCDAANRTTLRGQILRLLVSGLPAGGGPQVARSLLNPGDNPWAGASNANEKLVFAYGMRNPWRYQIDRVTGVLYGCDVGEANFEEESEIHAGDFLGWPWREANLSLVRASCPEPGGVGAQPYVAPIAFFARDTQMHAIVSAGMYRPAIGGIHNWPPLYYPDRGDVFYLDYYVGNLKRIQWNGSSWVAAAAVPGQPSSSSWAAGLTSAVDFLVGPDGSLWWMAQYNSSFDPVSGNLNRIRYTGPTAVMDEARVALGLRAVPNPAREATEIAFGIPRPERVRLALYDLNGRRLRVLVDGIAPAGETRARWDGTDESGAAAPAGVYFARLEREGQPAATLRVLRVR
ncbi:MAG: PQQ-dependent sugar dehydrogenase [Candidatus Eisenbacteria bacterium]